METQRLPKVLAKMPAGQRKAGKYLVGFFALMLALTLLSRGLDSMTVPTVTTGDITSGAIGRRITVSGSLEALGKTAVTAPSGHLIASIPVEEGSRVEQGDTLAVLDLEHLEEQITTARRQLEKARLQAQISLLEAETQAADAVEAARKKLERAEADLEQVAADGQRDAQWAWEEVNSARSDRTKLRKDDAEDGEIREASRKVQSAIKAAEDASLAAEKSVLEAQRAIEDARRELEQAELEQQNQAARDAVDSQKTALESRVQALEQAELEEALAKLTGLLENEGRIVAPQSGVISKVNAAAGSFTGGEGLFLISDESRGMVFKGNVEEKEGDFLARGDQGELLLPGQNMPVTAPLTTLSAPQEKGGEYQVTVQLPGQQGTTDGTATFTIDKRSQVYQQVVQQSALHSKGGGDSNSGYVYVLREQNTLLGVQTVVEQVDVQILEQNGTLAAVSGIFEAGDQVVTGSSRSLNPGDRVKLQ